MIATPETPPIVVTDAGSVDSLPEAPAVFALWAGEHSRYVARTALLGRRVRRVVKLLGLADVLTRIEYWPVASPLEGMLLHYRVSRRLFPDSYLKLIRLRMPAWIRVMLENPFPRTQVSTRLSGSKALHYGPFRTRADAENFQSQFLELFQIRRCQEDLEPSPAHPGCIYGEMNLCLRPCQEVVSAAEYRSEVQRVLEFLTTDGASLLSSASAARDRFSEEQNFEEAARQHKRCERIRSVLSLREPLVRDIDRLFGVVVTLGPSPETVHLHVVQGGVWGGPVEFAVEHVSGSLDHRLREILEPLETPRISVQERQEHAALLARWYYSSWRQGEWVAIGDPERVPWKKIVRAVSKVLAAS